MNKPTATPAPPSAARAKDTAAPAAAASQQVEVWPIPPYYEPDVEDAPFQEAATARLRDGRTLSGMLMRFDPERGECALVIKRGAAPETIKFDALLDLHLTKPLKLRRRQSIMAEKEDVASAENRSQSFQVTLINDETLQGETIGFEVQAAGLYLYIANGAEGVKRVFVPTTAIKSRQIGRRLGELLVAEQRVTASQVSTAVEHQSAQRNRKIGEYLAQEKIISRSDLAAAIAKQRDRPVMRMGEALIEMGIVSAEQLNRALERQKESRGRPLGQLLIELGYITTDELQRSLTQQLGFPFVDLSRFEIDPSTIKLVPPQVAIEYNALPLCVDGRKLVLAVENPLDPAPRDKIRFLTGMAVAPVVASGEQLRAAVRLHYGERPGVKIEELAAELDVPAMTGDDAGEELVSEADSILVRLVNKMILDAHDAKASDIHIETNPGRKPVVIRFRQDGSLREYLTLPASYRSALISRIKIMASLDISEKRRAQDGKINFAQFGPAKLELRLATLPTFDGLEDAVMRLLASGSAASIDKLGLRDAVLEPLKKVVQRPYGILLVCGPTGSGKTTTLHSILNHINTPDIKIWTAEDPIEIQQAGLRQVQVNPKIGWTFAQAMRSFLRADPDIIMVGEMRDEETARIGIEASLTGHIVFSTLHTNSAPESIVRLLDMGVQPFNFADSLLGVLAQRLVRRLCKHCKTEVPLDAEALAGLAAEYCADTALDPVPLAKEWHERAKGKPQLMKAVGCEQCGNTGYAGRLGIHELLVNSPVIRPLIRRSASVDEIRAAAIAEGLRTLKQDGIEKCLEGITDLMEVRAACA